MRVIVGDPSQFVDFFQAFGTRAEHTKFKGPELLCHGLISTHRGAGEPDRQIRLTSSQVHIARFRNKLYRQVRMSLEQIGEPWNQQSVDDDRNGVDPNNARQTLRDISNLFPYRDIFLLNRFSVVDDCEAGIGSLILARRGPDEERGAKRTFEAPDPTRNCRFASPDRSPGVFQPASSVERQ